VATRHRLPVALPRTTRSPVEDPAAESSFRLKKLYFEKRF
jgi:hypothetical protein